MRRIDIREPVDIERLLVWAYRDQRADVVLGAGHGLFDQEAALDSPGRHATSRDGVAAMARIGALGVRVDAGRASAAPLHIDAEVVHEAVTMLDRWTAPLVIRYARGAGRPDDVIIVPPRPGPLRNERGRIIRRYAEWDTARHYGWTPIGWTVEPSTAETVNHEYTNWWRALDALAVALSGDRRLTHHRPLRPTAPRAATVRYARRTINHRRSTVPDPDMLVV